MAVTGLWICVLLGICVSVRGTSHNFILDSMPDVVDELWKRSRSNWIIVTGSHLATFFSRYDPEEKKQLALSEQHFVTGDVTWQDDFAEFGMSSDFARAYFRQFDMEHGMLWLTLTIEDMDTIVDTCDKHTNGPGLGYLTEEQFHRGFTEEILRGLPFALLFVRTLNNENPLLPEIMKWPQFQSILQKIDKDGDENATKQEFEDFWEAGSYGPKSTGAELFGKLDYPSLGFLNQTHWLNLFEDLKCHSDGSGVGTRSEHLKFDQFMQLDLILQGKRIYPVGVCST